jgi:integrase
VVKVRQRANGDSDVYPRKNKHGKVIGYRGAYWIRTAEGFKRRYVSGKNKSETRAALAKARGDRDDGLIFDAGDLTLQDFLERWLQDSVKGSVSHRTYHNYDSQIRNHLAPVLGRIKLKTLSPAHIQRLYRAKLDSGLSTASVRYQHAVLHRALNQATRWGLVPRNVCDVVDPPKVVNKEVIPLNFEQSRAFLEASAGDRYEALYTVALTCGLREGELLGLMKKDLDLSARALRVERQLLRMRDGSGYTFPEPKHSSKRAIKLPERAANALEEHLDRQEHEVRRAGDLYRDQDLLFATDIGTPLDASNVVNRSFKPLLRDTGLPNIRFHDLRHTCATLLLLQGVHPKFVQRLLGHKSINITLDLYSHWMPDMGDFTADAMDNIL